MSRILFAIVILCGAVSCSRAVRFDIEGQLVNRAASEVYLVVEGEQVDTLASARVADDNTFHLRGSVEEPTMAFICDDNGNALTMLLTESSSLTLTPLAEGGYRAEGGPINDKYNLIITRLSDIARQAASLDLNNMEAAEQYESLWFKYHDVLSTEITANLDNIIGVELFLEQESSSMTAEDMRVRFAQFSPQMQALEPMRRFKEYIEIVARAEVGQPFVDIPLTTTTGEQTLSEVCKGRWVLLDFWATWCEPCLAEMPVLQQAYEKYAIQGFEICAVSLDKDQARWRAFVEQNNLLWTSAIDTPAQGEESVVDIYGLNTIPANFLISPDGVIVARNLFGEALLHELEHRFE